MSNSILWEQSFEITTPAFSKRLEFIRLEIPANSTAIPRIAIGSITFNFILIFFKIFIVYLFSKQINRKVLDEEILFYCRNY